MSENFSELKKQLDSLIRKGDWLYFAMLDEQGLLSEENEKKIKERKITLPNFYTDYDSWYSASLVFRHIDSSF